MQRKSRSTAFTLVEILVVLAIIVILAALLFPIFSRVREQGRASTCRSNLKQLALAVQLYAQDNNGRLPFLFGEDLIAPYLSNTTSPKALFHCPSQVRPDPHSTEYSYNTNEDIADSTIAFNIGKQESRVLKPATTWLQTDMVDFPPDDAHSQLVKPANGLPCVFTTTWHSGGANYSFVDGHVKWMLPESACALYNESLLP